MKPPGMDTRHPGGSPWMFLKKSFCIFSIPLLLNIKIRPPEHYPLPCTAQGKKSIIFYWHVFLLL